MSSYDDQPTVPEAVSRACTESAGTVQALAREVGVSYAALCSWSRGRRQPPPHRLRRLADVLDVRAERLREVAAELRSIADTAPGHPLTAARQDEISPDHSRLGLRAEPSRAAAQRPREVEAPLPRAAAPRSDAAMNELQAQR